VKEQVAAAIVRARTDLENALSDLEKLPAFDPGSVMYAAHALNNFLTVTGGTAELLLTALADHPDPQVRTWLEGIQDATNLMSHIATELMKNASARSAPRLTFAQLDLPQMAKRFCAFYQRKANPKRIRLLLDAPADLPPAWGDRVATAVVLDNLFSNAVKYSPRDKQVYVTVRAEPGGLVCGVRDEGPGLSAEDRSKLFQKGVRLGSIPTGGEVSTGYGLAVAKEFITLQGGEIWCESEPGRGATFSIRLPAYQAALHGTSS
jgi:signal transduction histidine kinase